MGLFGPSLSSISNAVKSIVQSQLAPVLQSLKSIMATQDDLQQSAGALLQQSADQTAAITKLAADNAALATAVNAAITAIGSIPGSPPPVTQAALDAVVATLQQAVAANTASASAEAALDTAVAGEGASLSGAIPPVPTAQPAS